MIPGHGIRGSYFGSRAGILVSIKKLRVRGVPLTKDERAALKPIVGELIISRVHDANLEFQLLAELIVRGAYDCPSREASLISPVIFSADSRGMLLYGVEKQLVDGEKLASYWQTWQVLFGVSAAEPPL